MTQRLPSLVVFADDWGRHMSSCQHLVQRLRPHYRILWINSIGTRRVRLNSWTIRRSVEKISNWWRGLRAIDEHMWTLDMPMLPWLGGPARALNRFLVGRRLRRVIRSLDLGPPVILTTLPFMFWFTAGIRRRGLIFYCTDDYSSWLSANAGALRQAEAELCREADLILAASRLLEARHRHTGRCEYFPHGVDYHHFAAPWEPKDVPADLANLPAPRAGFFGLIYRKLDFDLLAAVAGGVMPASLVLIGPVSYCPKKLTDLPNVHLLGVRPYGELPRYLAGLDVLLLPYRSDDDMIRHSSPLKLKECLATGKPTISVDLPEAAPAAEL